VNGDLVIREYKPDDFDVVTILWRIAREKSVPEFQREKGHFFYEDQEYFQKNFSARSGLGCGNERIPRCVHGDGK